VCRDLDRPVELDRDGLKFGGTTALITRVRDVLHPNGFSFVIPSSNWSESPTDAQLSASTSYTIKYPHKMIPIAKIVFVDSVTFTATADGASGATTSTKIDFVFSQAYPRPDGQRYHNRRQVPVRPRRAH